VLELVLVLGFWVWDEYDKGFEEGFVCRLQSCVFRTILRKCLILLNVFSSRCPAESIAALLRSCYTGKVCRSKERT
jgi:hypothetical protein